MTRPLIINRLHPKMSFHNFLILVDAWSACFLHMWDILHVYSCHKHLPVFFIMTKTCFNREPFKSKDFPPNDTENPPTEIQTLLPTLFRHSLSSSSTKSLTRSKRSVLSFSFSNILIEKIKFKRRKKSSPCCVFQKNGSTCTNNNYDFTLLHND